MVNEHTGKGIPEDELKGHSDEVLCAEAALSFRVAQIAMMASKKDTPNAKRAKLMRKDGGAFSCADVRDNGKQLGYWDDTGRCNRSRRNAQKIGSHRRRAILKLRTHKEIISSYEYRNR